MPNSLITAGTSGTPTSRSARLTLTLGRKALDAAAYARVARVRVNQDLHASTRLEVLLRDEDGAFSQAHTLNLGDPLSVSLDWNDGSPSTPLAQGQLTGLGTQYSTDGTLLRVLGHGPRYRLQHGSMAAAYQRMSSGDVMTQAARKKRIQLQARDARLRLPHMLVANQTVARLLEEQAARAGLVLEEAGDQVQIKPLKLSGTAVTLTYGQTLHDIRVEVNSLGQVTRVKVYGVDLATHKSIVGEAGTIQALGLIGANQSGSDAAKKAFGDAILQVGDCPVRSAGEARALAKALYNERLFQFVTAWGQASGCPDLKAGGLVELAGLGRKLSGRYLVTRVEHRYVAGDSGDGQAENEGTDRGLGFQTHFEACRPAIGR